MPELLSLENWTATTLPTIQTWQCVAFGNDIFVAVGYGANSTTATNIYATSTDGINWTSRTLPASQLWTLVWFVGDRFILASASAGRALYSSLNGITWTLISGPTTTGFWVGAAYGNGYYLIFSSLSQVWRSENVITWAQQPNHPGGATSYSMGVKFGSGVFCYVPTNGNSAYRSADGAAWTPQLLPVIAPHGSYEGLTFGNGLFMVMDDERHVVTSPDTISWTQRADLPVAQTLLSYGNGVFLASNRTAGIAFSCHSINDGVNWEQLPVPLPWLFWITFGADVYVGVACAISPASNAGIISNILPPMPEVRRARVGALIMA